MRRTNLLYHLTILLCFIATGVSMGQVQIDSLSTTYSCFDQNYQVEVFASGGTAPLLYSNNGGTNFQAVSTFPALNPATYQLRVRDALGAFVDSTIVLKDLKALTIDSISTRNPRCGLINGGAQVFASGEGPLEFKVDFGPWQTDSSFNLLTPGTHTLSVRDSMGCVKTQSFSLNGISPPSLTVSLMLNPSCSGNDGEIHLDVFGNSVNYNYAIDSGQGNLTFQLDSIFIGLGAGTYNLYVQDDNGCLDSLTLILIETNDVSINSIQSTAPTCANANGSLLVFASGGTAPLEYSIDSGATYQLSPFFSGLPAGSYDVKVKDFLGCSSQQSFNLNSSQGVQIDNILTEASSCGLSNGSIRIFASGGSAPYSYSIDGGQSYQATSSFTGLDSGSYIISVLDNNGCVDTDTALLDQYPLPSFNSITLNHQPCLGEMASLNIDASGTGNLNYSIDGGSSFSSNPTFSNLNTGTYQLVIKDSLNCETDSSITLINLELTKIFKLNIQPELCGNQNGSVLISAQSDTSNLQYSLDGGTTYQTDSLFTGLQAAAYNLRVLHPSGCFTDTLIQIPLHSKPALDSLVTSNAHCSSNNGSATAYSSGSLLYNWNGTVYSSSNTASNLSAGTHYVLIQDSLACADSISFSISLTSALSLNKITFDRPSCLSVTGGFTLKAIGGLQPYQYSIDNGVSFVSDSAFAGLLTGQYQVQIKDALGCTIDSLVLLEAIPAPGIDSLQTIASSCANANGLLNIFHSNHSSSTYAVDGGAYQTTAQFNNLSPGVHVLYIKDSIGCISDTSFLIPTINSPQVDSLQITQAFCGANNGTLTAFTSAGSGTIEYSLGGAFQASNLFQNLTPGSYTLSIRDDSLCVVQQQLSIGSLTPLQVVVDSLAQPFCFQPNGSIKLGSTGGGTSKLYSFNQAAFGTQVWFNNLGPGDYWIKVKDETGCIDSLLYTLSPIPALNLVSGAIPASCTVGNGSFNIQATGGTAPYQYSIDGGLSFSSNPNFPGLDSGNFQIAILDATGCSFDTTIYLDRVNPPRLDSVRFVNDYCNFSTGEMHFSATGAGLQYSLNNAPFTNNNFFVALDAGTYLVSIKDSLGCRLDTNLEILLDEGVVIDSLSIEDVNCTQVDGSITIYASGGARPYLYSSDGGFSYSTDSVIANLTPASYDVIVRDTNGCLASLTIPLSSLPPPQIYDILVTPLNCNREYGSADIQILGGEEPFRFSLDSGFFQGVGIFDSLSYGWHYVVMYDARYCRDSISFFVDSVAGHTWRSLSTTSANCNQNNGNIEISTMLGAGNYLYSIDSGATFQTDSLFNNLSPGLYHVVVSDSLGCNLDSTIEVEGWSPPTWASIDSSYETCNQSDGFIHAVANSAGSLTYTLNGSSQTNGTFNNLAQGWYSLTVADSNGCSIDTSIFIFTKNGPRLDSSSTSPTTCGGSNGTSMLYHSGGQGPFVYSANGVVNGTSLPLTGLNPGWNSILIQDINLCSWTDSVFVANISEVQASVSQVTDANCDLDNGRLLISATGGISPYRYAIDTNDWKSSILFTGVAAGSYMAYVMDASGCLDSIPFNINQAGKPQFSSINLVHSSCDGNNGSIEIVPNSGVAPYLYSFDGGQTLLNQNTLLNLNADTFNLQIIDASGCFADTTIVLRQLNKPSILAAQISEEHCGLSDGSISLQTQSIGNTTYSIDGINYQSSPIFSGLSAGFYPLFMLDSLACRVDTGFTVPSAQALNLSIVNFRDPSCGLNNGRIQLLSSTNTGTELFSIDGVNFQTSGNFNNLPPGNYLPLVKDGFGCSDQNSLQLVQRSSPVITGVDSIYSCADQSYEITVRVTNGTAPILYSVNSGLNWSTDSVFTGQTSGLKNIIVFDANGCSDTIQVQLLNRLPLSINSVQIDQPACGNQDGSVKVNASGMQPLRYSIDGVTWQYNNRFSNLAPGVYNLRVRDSLDCFASQQLVLTNIAPPSIAINAVQNPTCGYRNGFLSLGANGAGPFLYALDSTGIGLVTYSTDSVYSNLGSGNYTIYVKDTNECVSTQIFSLFEVNNMVIKSISTQSPDCNNANGSITFSASGGTAPLTYSIDGGLNMQSTGVFNGLAAGTYNLLIRDDKGCEKSQTHIIHEPQIPSIDALEVIPVNCGAQNGTIQLFISGGLQPYEVSIDGGNTFTQQSLFTGLSTGSYSVVVKDQKNCFRYDTAFIDSVATPEWTSIFADSAYCENFGGSIQATVQGAGIVISLDSGARTNSSGNFYNLAAGWHSLMATDSLGCQIDTLINLPSRDLARIVNVEIEPETCESQNGSILVRVSGNKSQVTYSIDGYNFQSDSLFNNLPAGNYDVWVKHPSSCSDVLTVTVPEYSSPRLSSMSKQPASCGLNNASVSIQTSGGTGNVEISWNGGPFGSLQTFGPVADGNYYVVLRDSLNCRDSVNFSLSRASLPGLDSLSAMNPICGAANGSILMLAKQGVPPYQYSINGGVNYQSSPLFNGLGPASYNLRIKDALHCTWDSTTSLIQQNAPTILQVVADSSYCSEANGQLQVVATGTGILEYSLDQSNWQAQPLFDSLPPGVYNVFVQDLNGCTSTQASQVFAYAPLSMDSLKVTPGTCAEPNGSIAAFLSGGKLPIAYSLDGLLQNQATPIFDNLAPGKHQLTAVDANGCVYQDSIEVQEIQVVDLQLVNTLATTCDLDNGIVELSVVNGSGPFNYSLDGVLWQQNSIFDSLPRGTHEFYILDAFGCTDSLTVQIDSVPQLLLDSIYSQRSSCGLSNGALQVYPSMGRAPYSYSLDGVNYQSSNTFTNLFAGVYTVWVKDAGGCVKMDSLQITNQPSTNLFVDNIKPESCANNDGSFTVNPTGLGPFLYSIDLQLFSSDSSFSGLSSGWHQYFVLDANSCISSDSVFIPVNDNFTSSVFIVDNQLICLNEVSAYSLNSNLVLDACIWNLGDGTIIYSCDPFEHIYQQKGCYDVMLQVSSLNGCYLDTLLKNQVCVEDLAQSSFISSTNGSLKNGSAVDLENFSKDADSVAWYLNGEYFSSAFEPNLIAQLEPEQKELEICLEAYNSLACADVTCYTLRVEPTFKWFIANSFSPNGDGKNETFGPHFEYAPKELYSFSIYDRWGELVFNSSTPGEVWDGNIGGSQVISSKTESYVYHLIFKNPANGFKVETSGSVIVLH